MILELANPKTALASNLGIALFSLPRIRRADALTFYCFCRTIDDIADSPEMAAADKIAQLDEWLAALHSGKGLPLALNEVICRNDLDTAHLVALVTGCRRDAIEPFQPFLTLESLRQYCWQVACAVGIPCTKIFGATSPDAIRFAEHLGYALQFTNILRDVSEDAAIGRIYLPKDLLTRHSLDTSAIFTLDDSPALRQALAEFSEFAVAEFVAARATFPQSDARALLPTRLMEAFYGALLKKICRSGYAVIERRHRLTTLEKAVIFIQQFLRH